MSTQTSFHVLPLGRIAYLEAMEIQKKHVEGVIAGRLPQTLLVCEHPPVITFGRRAKKENIKATVAELAEHEVSVFFADRGGDVTFHGPGQIVIYPVIDLRRQGRDIHRYMRNLEKAIIYTLRDRFGLNAYRPEKMTGVWVGPYKVASIGIGVRHWVAYHGLALNVRTDMRYFSMIRACGLDIPMASLASFFRDEFLSYKEIQELLIRNITQIFGGIAYD